MWALRISTKKKTILSGKIQTQQKERRWRSCPAENSRNSLRYRFECTECTRARRRSSMDWRVAVSTGANCPPAATNNK
jgi:hypothetical protein